MSFNYSKIIMIYTSFVSKIMSTKILSCSNYSMIYSSTSSLLVLSVNIFYACNTTRASLIRKERKRLKLVSMGPTMKVDPFHAHVYSSLFCWLPSQEMRGYVFVTQEIINETAFAYSISIDHTSLVPGPVLTFQGSGVKLNMEALAKLLP